MNAQELKVKEADAAKYFYVTLGIPKFALVNWADGNFAPIHKGGSRRGKQFEFDPVAAAIAEDRKTRPPAIKTLREHSVLQQRAVQIAVAQAAYRLGALAYTPSDTAYRRKEIKDQLADRLIELGEQPKRIIHDMVEGIKNV